MRFKNWTLPYSITYILVWFTKQGFFRRVTRQGLSNIPKNKPVIFAANHQNSLIDPIVIATTNRYPVFFLTKSDVFKNPTIAKILYALNMLPIYRERDGSDFMEKNKNQKTHLRLFTPHKNIKTSKKKPSVGFKQNQEGLKKNQVEASKKNK